MKTKNDGPAPSDHDAAANGDEGHTGVAPSFTALNAGHHAPGSPPLVARGRNPAHQVHQAHRAAAPIAITALLHESLGHTAHRRVKRGECLFRTGDAFRCIYPIRSGFFKTLFTDDEGREQVTGFLMSDEHLGLDGLDTGSYHHTAVALEDSEVIAVPYALIEEAGRETPAVRRRLDQLLAEEIVRHRDLLMVLGSMHARERVAAFLVNLSARLQQRGYSASEFQLRMSRDDIGSYLGLKLETVSRLLSAMNAEGLLKVEQRHITILDLPGLEKALRRDG